MLNSFDLVCVHVYKVPQQVNMIKHTHTHTHTHKHRITKLVLSHAHGQA